MKPVLSLYKILLLLFACSTTSAETYSLPELIDLALRQNAEINAQQWRVEKAQSNLMKAKASRILPRLRFKSYSGMVPEAKGNIIALDSDTSGLRPLGPFIRSELEFTQPLFVAKASNFLLAAHKGVEVEQAAMDQKSQDIEFLIKEFYYGLLLTNELALLVDELMSTMDNKITEIEDTADLSLSNQYKLRFARLDLQQKKQEVEQKHDLARAALALYVGLPEDHPLPLAEKKLVPRVLDLPDFEMLAEKAIPLRPEWRQFKAGLIAKKALADAATGAYYPQIFISGGVRHAYAPHRTDQHNPFVKDDFNLFNLGLFIGVKQSFEWGLIRADVARKQAAYKELKALESTGIQGLRLDLHRTYNNTLAAKSALELARQTRKLSRQWLRQAQEAYEFDEDEVKELVNAFENWALSEQNYYQQTFNYNIALAKLEKDVGGISLDNMP